MSNEKDLTVKEAFALAIQNHQNNNLQDAQSYYQKVLKIDPNYTPAHNNLGAIFKQLGELEKAKECYEKAIEINPNYADAYNNLGVLFKELGNFQKAKECFEKAISINPNNANSHNNLGITFKDLGQYQKAKSCYEKAIEINSNFTDAHNNLGNIFQDLGELQKAKECFEKAIEINPNYKNAYWNLHGLSTDIDGALLILKKLNKIDINFTEDKIMIAALEGFKGNFSMLDDILSSSNSSHPYTRSIKWVFSLPKLPNIFFDRWLFFDAVIKLANNSRPFYEFGVWNGYSFKYLIKTFKKGFGFDTFSGLPEDWHNQKKGTYSSFGVIPKIEGGEFIVGKFEDTLPNFFSEEKPKASLINFDADLYSSTLCALNYSNKVIDEKTILVFDEFIMNGKWEEDEFKALNEFCDNLGYSYEVLAVSFFTKQVAVRLNKFISN
jgi:tetratricopeptide (TPR) repeat protein